MSQTVDRFVPLPSDGARETARPPEPEHTAPMRILFHHRIASRDGQFVHMEELVTALRARGETVEIVGPAHFAEAEFGDDAGFVDWLKRNLPSWLYEILEFGYNWVAYRRLMAACRAYRPDVIYERYNLYTLAGIWARRRFGVPLLLEVNAPLAEERARHGTLALKRFAAWTERKTWRGADAVLPVTSVLADDVKAAGVPEARIAIIPNGIDEARFGAAPSRAEAKARLGLGDATVLGFTGFVRAWHRLDRVIDLLADASDDLRLLIVGDGDARADLEAHAAARGVADRVTVTGIVGREDVPAHVAAFDIALQPGVTRYASPLKLFEYMAVGAAIVAPNTPNIRDVLTHEQDALLFRDGDSAAFAEATSVLIADAALRARLGEGARATIARRGLYWSRNAERVVALATRLIEANARR